MISCRGRYILSLILILTSLVDGNAQEKRKISINVMAGSVFFPKSEKIPTYGQLPTDIFGGYSISGMGGLGLNYRLTNKVGLFENLTFLYSSKRNNSLGAATFKTGVNYNFLHDKKISPFVFGSLDFSLMFLKRKENTTDYFLDSTTNTIGQGYGGTRITYNEEKLNLSYVPVAGASLGAGVNVKLSNKTTLFLAYSYNTALASRSHIIKENYFNNKSDFNYSMVNVGLTIHLFKKTKQLLATLNKDQWEGDKTVSVRGTIVYNKNKKSNHKIIPVELTTVKDSTLKVIPSEKEGVFFVKDLKVDDYKFMLENKNRKIKNAELEVIHDHRKVKVVEEFVSLDMLDDQESENLISRDGNFSVVLREGFQHEVDMSVTGMSITGKLSNVNPDTSCSEVQILLYDQQDSLIKGVPAGKDCSFNLIDVVPGQYKMVFRNDDRKGKISFDYQFTEATPNVTRQVNAVAPKISYFITGKVYVEDSLNAGKIDLHLVDKYYKVIDKTSLTPPGEFMFEGLVSGDYQIDFELSDKNARGKIIYTVQADNSAFRKDFVYYFGKTNEGISLNFKAKGQIMVLPSKASEGTDVYLIDPSHQIIQKTQTDKDGYFHFDKLPSKEYKVAYAISDSTLKTDLKYTILDDNNHVVDDVATNEEVIIASATAIKKMSVVQKVKNREAKKNSDQGSVSETNKTLKNISNKASTDYASFKTHQTYTADGKSIHPTGFGVQVGSFKLISNLKKDIQRLKEEGYIEIFIQVVALTFNGKTEKLYRVILGVYEDLNDLRDYEETLKKAGFQTICRKHI